MSIEKNMKLAQKFFTVSFIMAVVQISSALFYEFLITANSTTLSFDFSLICVILIEIFAPFNGMNTKKYYQKYTASLEKN
jgi:ABC-type bacteriocin/lantibiotic exporter with double-glycine peptidase domain